MSAHKAHRSDHPAAGFPVVSTAELLRGSARPDYLIDHILQKGRPCVVGGPAKCLKSGIMVYEAAVSLAAGAPFLGTFPVRKSPVLIFAGETPAEDQVRVVRAVTRAKGLDPDRDLTGLSFAREFPRLPRDAERVGQTICRTGARVVILDPAYLAFPEVGTNAGNMFVVGEAWPHCLGRPRQRAAPW